jgi:hypothetical protein
MQPLYYWIFLIVTAARESIASKDGIQHLILQHGTQNTDADKITRAHDGTFSEPHHIAKNETTLANQQVGSEIKTSSVTTTDVNVSKLHQIIACFSRSVCRLPVLGTIFSRALGQKIDFHATTSRTLELGLSFREGLYALSVYLVMGVIAYSFVLEKWSAVDSLYFTCTCLTTGEFWKLR